VQYKVDDYWDAYWNSDWFYNKLVPSHPVNQRHDSDPPSAWIERDGVFILRENISDTSSEGKKINKNKNKKIESLIESGVIDKESDVNLNGPDAIIDLLVWMLLKDKIYLLQRLFLPLSILWN
jgi:hypothetical protein